MTTHPRLPVKKLLANPANPRTIKKHKLDQLVKSLRDFPQMLELRPIVVESLDHPVVLGGNMRLQALKVLGVEEVPVVPADGLTEAQRAEFVIKDNVGFGDWDWDALANDWDPIELEDWGLDLPDLTAADLQLTDDAEDVPEVPSEPLTKPGDLWILGNHRLLCGDSTQREAVDYLLHGAQLSLIHADPPYFGKVDADWDNNFEGLEGFLKFLRSVFDLWAPHLLDRGTSGWWCAPDYAWHVEQALRAHFAIFNHVVWYKGKSLGITQSVEAMRRWRPRSERLLLCEKQHSPDALLASFNAKTAHIASRTAYSEIIDRLIRWKEQAKLGTKEIDRCLGTNGMAGHYFGRSQWALPTEEAWEKLRPLFASRGVDIGSHDAQRSEFDAQRREFDAQRSGDNFTDVWECSAPLGEDRNGHPTPKPVELVSKIVSAHSRPADLVADPFLGSGTTLVVCEQLGRTCYGMELDPKYCDVIVARWEKLTGQQAVRSYNLNDQDREKK